MIQILGDNQFFGVNHNDIDKGDKTKKLFSNNESIISFIHASKDIGLSGFMMNSNPRGYEIANSVSKAFKGEIHYSVPYPHKFASMVNEGGILMLLKYVFSKSSFRPLFLHFPQFLITGNIKYILPLILDLEIPKNIKKGSFVYLQNVVTDLLLGMKRYDLLESFCNSLISKGYYPGLITLNPILLDKVVSKFDMNLQTKLIICFNINKDGFNVFPCLNDVEGLIFNHSHYKKMGMSILSSGGASNIQESLHYIKSLPLDYVVYGSSSIKNIKTNFEVLNKRV
jgi:hypothetical protein